MNITTPSQLFEFLRFDTNRTYDFLARGELVRLLLDWNALEPDRRGGECYEMDKAENLIHTHCELCGIQTINVWDGLNDIGKIEFFVVLFPPPGGFNADNTDPSEWDIWDDETDYNNPHAEVDTTSPDDSNYNKALGKKGVLIFTPGVVAAFQKWQKEQVK